MPKPPFHLFAVVPPGLETLAAAELADEQPEVLHGGLAWSTDWDGLFRAHLHSRVCSRILIRIARFGARALGELERKVAGIEWDGWLPAERRSASLPPPTVEVSCRRSRLYHERAVRQRVLSSLGWADAGDAVRGDPDDPWRLQVRVHRDTVTLSLDATGPHLHRRGYRQLTGAAPLRETLAAAAILASGWRPEQPFLDPFAGSGTIPIEAALMARRIPPALAQASREPTDFPFLRWPDTPMERWAEHVGRAQRGILPRAPGPIFVSDRDERVLRAALGNAEAAGVHGDLEIRSQPMTEAVLDGAGRAGWIVTNPPYGGRLGDRKALRPFYRALGAHLADGWGAWGFCAWIGDRALMSALDRELSRRGGLSLEPVIETRNGGIAVTLVRRAMPQPHDPPSAP